jgi:SAM-dependent methyltransferase
VPGLPAPPDQESTRRLLSRHLVGRGIELGPGHIPFPLPLPGVHVAYVDRLAPDTHRALFPELGESVEFPRTDVICDLDVDRLKPFDDRSQDFVVASHILEHVADPIGILDEIHRVLRPGGTALVLLPDRRRTFDASRQPTPLDHVVREFEAGVTEVDDDHILQFVRCTEGLDAYEALSEADRRAFVEMHRRRSIHAHCWHEDEFLDVLLYAIGELGHEWDFVEGVLADDEGTNGFEFGYVLRRMTEVPLGAVDRRERFQRSWTAWADERRALHARLRATASASRPSPSRRTGIAGYVRRLGR